AAARQSDQWFRRSTARVGRRDGEDLTLCSATFGESIAAKEILPA
ncbi:MAG: hypothetical protein ACI9C1_003623, partial [Candidatus Aldehydirespiratoraceae bacterium]